jgi:hypothetical protein
MLLKAVRMIPDRAVLNVVRRDECWAVEFDGEVFGLSLEKEITMAAANRRVQQLQGSGRPCQVRVIGEPGFYGVTG